jgi:thymidylate kinase
MIDQYLTGKQQLDDHVIHLLFSANRWEAMTEMRQKLQSGVTLVVDRYAYSGVVFSAAKVRPMIVNVTTRAHIHITFYIGTRYTLVSAT